VLSHERTVNRHLLQIDLPACGSQRIIVEEQSARFVVHDHNGQALAYFFRDHHHSTNRRFGSKLI
jgi:hypothetical protein